MDFFDHLFFEKIIRTVNVNTFMTGIIIIKGTPRIVSREEEPTDNPDLLFTPIDVYDDDQLVGTYKLGKKTYKGQPSFPRAFRPAEDVVVEYFE